MAETFIGAVLEGIVSKVISVTAELTKLAWGFKEELTKLRDCQDHGKINTDLLY
ncbi:hypothetical protein PVK06_034648 [Gossypium arboreum]|uniref:Uncharacterized protein n=1 Tax=Gossypium arboreum TaxID=29729 RepID=A0ABR0NFD2_GOSAR|nr:hypothetical protein PVK06_034648 [Gossypium arboreum]